MSRITNEGQRLIHGSLLPRSISQLMALPVDSLSDLVFYSLVGSSLQFGQRFKFLTTKNLYSGGALVMRRFLIIVFTFLICGAALWARSRTPNLKFNMPDDQRTNWHVPIVYNLNALDGVLPGSRSLTTGVTSRISQSGDWITAASSTPTVANFLNGFSAPQNGLICGNGDSYTTIPNSASIIVCGTCPSFTLEASTFAIGGFWHQVARIGVDGTWHGRTVMESVRSPSTTPINGNKNRTAYFSSSELISFTSTDRRAKTMSGDKSTPRAKSYSESDAPHGSLSSTGFSLVSNPASTGSVVYVSSSGPYTSLSAAFTTCPSGGCVIDMRGDSSAIALNLGDFDPGPKAVTILLGPYRYTVHQFALENSEKIIGMGAGGYSIQTAITADSTTVDPFILGTAESSVSGVTLADFRLDGAASNSTNGMNFQAAAKGSGLWHSTFHDIMIGAFTPFAKDGIIFDANRGGGLNQFLTFTHVVVYRKSGGGPALEIKGYNNSFLFENCEFDGPYQTPDGNDNVYIHDSIGVVFPPYDIVFDLPTTQWGGVGFHIAGALAVSILNGHFENNWGGIRLSDGASFASQQIHIWGSGFFNRSGIHRGAGYEVSVDKDATNIGFDFDPNNISFNIPDNYIIGNESIYRLTGFGTLPSLNSPKNTKVLELNVGSGGTASTGTISMPKAKNGWSCTSTDETTNIVTRETSFTSSSVSFTASTAWGARDHLLINCEQF